MMNPPPMLGKIAPLTPEPRSLRHLGIDDFELEDKVRAALDRVPSPDWAPTGLDKAHYLDVVEALVRHARDWQDERGAIIDPVEGVEFGQTSPRYTAPGAILLAFDRCRHLQESVYRAMDWCCRRLAKGKAESPDFWMRELVTAYVCLEPIADRERLASWAKDLRAVVPEEVYWKIQPAGQNLEALHNWTVYAATGEFMRAQAGLAPEKGAIVWGHAFFEKYMPAQLSHFTANGMYRDPDDPFTYDITTRLQFATALAFGYDGPLRADLDELLRRGALTQLLYVSPEGYVPFGGRSSQYHFQEAIISALCELEARRYQEAYPRLAGAFKRQAHRSARAVDRWLRMRPFRHIKNGFPRERGYGFDRYGKLSVYSLMAASVFGLAALFADDGIPELPCPAEVGGYCFQLAPAFHKAFATCSDTQVEVDTGADFDHDATGLGRFCRAGAPLELGLGMPIASRPAYGLPADWRAERNLAIGPEWRTGAGEWRRLAELSEGLRADLRVVHEEAERVAFVLSYEDRATGTVIRESYDLGSGRLRYEAQVRVGGAPVDGIRLLVPLLVTDGAARSTIETAPGRVSVTYRGATAIVSFDPAVFPVLGDPLVGNRNGLYRCLALETEGDRVGALLRLGQGE